MHEEYEVKMSPLSQRMEVDGKEIDVQIYEDGEGGWLLEVVDEFNNSTVWDDPFSSDQEAMKELQRAIQEDGVDSLIGPPPSLSH
jgi:hypothetical protein